MPGRIIPLINDEIYHVFNRGVSFQPTFFDQRDYQRLLSTIIYYQNQKPPMKLSRFLTLSQEERSRIMEEQKKKINFLIDIVCYCFMPNHLHFLLKQKAEKGISKFMGNIANSYARFVNTKQERTGPLFQGRFKAVRIEDNEQLIHVSRYIHLNPLTSYIVKSAGELEDYIYSSFPEYLGKIQNGFCQKEIILTQFKTRDDYKQSFQPQSGYKKFVLDQADYQKRLGDIKHLILEEKEKRWRNFR